MKLEVAILTLVTLMFASATRPARVSRQLLLNVARSMEQEVLSRSRRQTVNNPQGFKVRNAALDIPVPVNIPVYPGVSVPIDHCKRDEVLTDTGYYMPMCQKLLQQGNCKIDEVVLMDPETFKGYCAPRLCAPDRIFVHATQLCHDPQDTDVCPGGRELFNTAHGSAICDCPDGTTESSNGMYGDVCEPLLSPNRLCSQGQVYWFKDFNSPPTCLPDPCQGSNLNRGPRSLPFIPSYNTGKCYQLGQTTGVCEPGLIYALHLTSLKGVCETLENLGYDVLTPEELQALNQLYGITIVKENTLSPTFVAPGQSALTESNIHFNSLMGNAILNQGSVNDQFQSTHFQSSQLAGPHFKGSQLAGTQFASGQFMSELIQNVNHIVSDYGITFLRSLGFKNPPVPGILVYHVTIRPSGEVITHIHPYSRKIRSHSNDSLDESFFFTDDDLMRLLEEREQSNKTPQVTKAVLQRSQNSLLANSIYKMDHQGQEGKLSNIKSLPTKSLSGDYSNVQEGKLLSSRNSLQPLYIYSDKSQVDEAALHTNATILRKKRQVQAHASPSNVFETKLQSCSPGAARDLNAKCRDTVLPASIPKSRGVRAAPPVAPRPSCPAGQSYDFRRSCSASSSVQSSRLANGLG